MTIIFGSLVKKYYGKYIATLKIDRKSNEIDPALVSGKV